MLGVHICLISIVSLIMLSVDLRNVLASISSHKKDNLIPKCCMRLKYVEQVVLLAWLISTIDYVLRGIIMGEVV